MSTNGGVIGSAMLRLAAARAEVEWTMAEAERRERQAARAAKLAENETAVAEMREQASDIARGALLQGAIGVVAGGASITGACLDPKGVSSRVLVAGGDALGRLTGPAGQLVGEAPARRHEANAAAARSRAEASGWQVDDADERARRADRRADEGLAALERLLEGQREANAAILTRM